MFYNNIDKLIYTCEVTDKKYDPLALYRKLIVSKGGVINQRLATWSDDRATDIDRAFAENDLVDITRSCFQLPSFEENDGYTDGVVLTCLTKFLGWLEKNG